MYAWFGVLLGASPLGTALELPPRDALVAIALAPGRSHAHGDMSSLLREVALALEPDTGLRVLSPEQAGLDQARLLACSSAERLTCWTREVLALGGEHDRLPIRYLLVLSLSRREGAASALTALLLDVDAARHRLERSALTDTEDAIYETTTRAGPVDIDLEGRGALPRVVAELLGAGLRDTLERDGRWGALGSLELVIPCDDCLLELDQQVLGAVTRGAVRVSRVPLGTHLAVVRRGARTVWTGRVQAEPGEPQPIELPVEIVHEPGAASGTRDLVLVGGGVAASLGVIGSVAGLAVASARAPYACVARSNQAADDDCQRPRSDLAGPLLAAGTGLATAGAAWLVVGALAPDDPSSEVGWAPLVLGAAAGVLSGVLVGLAL